MTDSTYQSKIVSLDALVEVARQTREAGGTVVQCHGCFDIVHPGHVRYLEFARRQGDLLIVSLTGDTDVAKGDQRPYIPQELRAENLAALMFVDYVYVDPNPTAEQVLAAVQPDVYVKGREYEASDDPRFQAEKRTVESYGGRLIYSSGDVVFSSTELIRRIPRDRELEDYRLQLVCERHGIHAGALHDLLTRFAGLRVMVIGDVLLDRYVFCDPVGVASEAPVLSLSQLDETSYVGGAAIVARHLSALGAQAYLLTAAGTDDESTRMARLLDDEGVEADLLPFRPAVVEKTRFLAADSKLFKVDRGRCLPLDSKAEKRAAAIIERRGREMDAVILCDFGYGMITAGLLNRVLPSLRHNVGTMAADVSGERGNLLNFRQVDLLCPTERELRFALNDFETGLSSVAWQLLNRTQARHVLVTLEKRGVLAFERQDQRPGSSGWSARLKGEQLPTFVDHPVDLLGCGDAMLATATLSLAAGGKLMQAAYLGSAAAALEAKQTGNQPIDEPHMRRWMRGRRELMGTIPSRHPLPVPV
jgi:rfaE bifunctional protein kinase chain/domain/rfaE bifunctional protein nucleotidyltransferase chain/domain